MLQGSELLLHTSYRHGVVAHALICAQAETTSLSSGHRHVACAAACQQLLTAKTKPAAERTSPLGKGASTAERDCICNALAAQRVLCRHVGHAQCVEGLGQLVGHIVGAGDRTLQACQAITTALAWRARVPRHWWGPWPACVQDVARVNAAQTAADAHSGFATAD